MEFMLNIFIRSLSYKQCFYNYKQQAMVEIKQDEISVVIIYGCTDPLPINDSSCSNGIQFSSTNYQSGYAQYIGVTRLLGRCICIKSSRRGMARLLH